MQNVLVNLSNKIKVAVKQLWVARNMKPYNLWRNLNAFNAHSIINNSTSV